MEKTLDFKPKFFAAIRNYDRKTFMADLMAGVIVGIVALPLAIAFGIASGVSPEKGIITAIVAGLMISLFGGSKVQIGGPTGAFIVIVYGIIQQYGMQGLTVATLMAGVFLILLGVLRLGTIIKYIPYPIVVGFTSGIAVTIFTTQIKDLFGLTIDGIMITPQNRKNVFEDDVDDEDEASVKFDGYGKLILNNAAVKRLEMGEMDLPLADGKEPQTQKKTLTIYLENLKKDADACNVIDITNNLDGKIVKFTGDESKKGDYQIEIKTSEEAPGALKILFGYSNLLDFGLGLTTTLNEETINKVIEKVFGGIALKYSDSFEFTLDQQNMTITLAQKIPTIVQVEKFSAPVAKVTTKAVDFSRLNKVKTLNLRNTVIDKVHFSLNDTHEKGFIGP